jgi:hypothetical protein
MSNYIVRVHSARLESKKNPNGTVNSCVLHDVNLETVCETDNHDEVIRVATIELLKERPEGVWVRIIITDTVLDVDYEVMES